VEMIASSACTNASRLAARQTRATSRQRPFRFLPTWAAYFLARWFADCRTRN
jgi:hypothetical protein